MTVGDIELRELAPAVLSVLVRRGADFATAEDAVQEALIRALDAWEREIPTMTGGTARFRSASRLKLIETHGT